MNLTLEMRYAATPQRKASAWFVAGRSVADWLNELAAWQTPLAEACLYVIPSSTFDRTPCGVLVLGAAPKNEKASPGSLPYGNLGNRMLLPVEGRLEPAVSVAEIDNLLESGDLHFWHPQAGLVELSQQHVLRVSDLLNVPSPEPSTWNAAVPGVALNGRLLSIEPELAISAEQMLEEVRGDIGTEPLDLNQLPSAPGEPAPGAISELGRAVEQGLAGAISWIMRQLPHTGSQRTWVNQLEDWANARLNRLVKSLEATRNRELLRLMNLLENDPDEGLRFAIPMGGGDHRGVAPPADQLARRKVDFDLNRLGGGRAADFWNMPPVFQQQLTDKYRLLAEREIALGRHRRAAYIFASLLGNLKLAANTLADGGHWREAAVLYEQRLHQPHEAARCLRQGGLWTEAIAFYEKLGEFETVGDLHQEIGQPVEAEAAWRRAVAKRENSGEMLLAARILEHKIGRAEEAYDALERGWLKSRQAEGCLAEAFQLLARHSWHPQAQSLVEKLPTVSLPPKLVTTLVEILSTQAGKYPDATVRERAADQARIVASQRLSAAGISDDDARRLVLAVSQIVAEDRLLARDGQRFLQQRSKPRTTRPAVRAARVAKLVRTLRFPKFPRFPKSDWGTAISTNDAIFVAGYDDRRHVAVVRMSWKTGEACYLTSDDWKVIPSQTSRPILMAADPANVSALIVHGQGSAEALPQKQFAVTDEFPQPLACGGHRGLCPRSAGLVCSSRETLHVVDFQHDYSLTVNAYLSATAQVMGLVQINLAEQFPPGTGFTVPVPLLVRERALVLGVGEFLAFAHRGQELQTVELPSPIDCLVGSARHTRERIVLGMQRGGMLLWGDQADAPWASFASEMVEPRVGLTRTGLVVAASSDEIEFYAAAGRELRLHSRAPGPGSKPLAALTCRRHDVALVLSDGRVLIYEVSV